ncbi:MAG: hypothetical protein EZS28_001167 [Streblomastix strix]|uniref:Uncharacterized protein n=1 Tax=Streblomastix strix TaxID=222440 RepID=A0A5J4X7V0_9EUKA|nr:MAG: hypothetical protein EZS28_001167 [Streblomastix strix]
MHNGHARAKAECRKLDYDQDAFVKLNVNLKKVIRKTYRQENKKLFENEMNKEFECLYLRKIEKKEDMNIMFIIMSIIMKEDVKVIIMKEDVKVIIMKEGEMVIKEQENVHKEEENVYKEEENVYTEEENVYKEEEKEKFEIVMILILVFDLNELEINETKKMKVKRKLNEEMIYYEGKQIGQDCKNGDCALEDE